MTFDEANELLKDHGDELWGKEETDAFLSFGIKLEHFICEKCSHLHDCHAIDLIDGDNFAIKSCNFFQTTTKWR